jgi:diaminopimelate epimerase
VRFHKYQALGNDYLVLEAAVADVPAELVRRLCDRHYGVGSDGALLPEPAPAGAFGLRIFNPDGSEAEKSGNGIRIFARWLFDAGRVGTDPIPIATRGGTVRCEVRDGGRLVFAEMGRASFDSTVIPVAGAPREVVDEELETPEGRVRFTAVSIGNPHCVVHTNRVTPMLARRLGPLIETHVLFPNRTNVQFVEVLDAHRIRVEIWERGAGYTLTSGSSSCAAAAAAVRLGRCSGRINVVMPGGTLEVGVGDDFSLTLLGPVRKVAEGELARELLAEA